MTIAISMSGVRPTISMPTSRAAASEDREATAARSGTPSGQRSPSAR